MDDHKEKFVHCWTDQHLHFGNWETSRAKGAHSVIKRYLQVSTGDLYNVLQWLSLMLTTQHTEHQAAMSAARNRTPQSLRILLFGSLVGHITPYALWRAFEQKQIMQRPTLQHSYRHSLLGSMGIPCYHVMQERISQSRVLYLYDFYQRWFFDLPSEDFVQVAPRPILDPITVKTKGRPLGSKNRQPAAFTQREPSQFKQLSQATKKRASKTTNSNPKTHKRTRTGRRKVVSSDESDCRDSEDRELEAR